MPTKLYVANLPPGTTEADLHGVFSQYGAVTELDIIKNYAFVHMQSHEAAQNAVSKLNNKDFQGFNIQVQFSRIQNVNRSNKSSMKYDRRDDNVQRRGRGDFIGRDHFRGRGGFRGNGPENFREFGDNFRGHGGVRGGRGGFEGFHRGRGKPYDRNQPVNPRAVAARGQNIGVQNTNLQPIRPAGNSTNFVRPTMNPPIRAPQNPQAHFPNQIPVQQPVQINPISQPQPVPAALPLQPQVSAVYQQQSISTQSLNYQHPQAAQPTAMYSGDPAYHSPHVGQSIPGAMPAHVVTPVVTPVLQQNPVQTNLQTANFQAGNLQPQSQNGVQLGYTVYERYVDYRNPQSADAQNMQTQANPAPATPQVYPPAAQVPVPTNKDPYTNAQLQYERHAVATSRAAVYANAYYGGNATSVPVPTSSVMQTIPVAGQSTVLQNLALQYP